MVSINRAESAQSSGSTSTKKSQESKKSDKSEKLGEGKQDTFTSNTSQVNATSNGKAKSEIPRSFWFTAEDLDESKLGKFELVGANEDNKGDIKKIEQAIKSGKTKGHVYMMGPGMEDWSAEEKQSIKDREDEIGIPWDKGGWQAYTIKTLQEYAQKGFYSAEIDNTHDVSGDELVKFLKQVKAESPGIKITLKNTDGGQLKAIKSASDVHDILAPYAIFEEDAKPVDVESLGIKAVRTTDTNNYEAPDEGYQYDLKG